jgi:hypothetical protein
MTSMQSQERVHDTSSTALRMNAATLRGVNGWQDAASWRSPGNARVCVFRSSKAHFPNLCIDARMIDHWKNALRVVLWCVWLSHFPVIRLALLRAV